MIHIALCDDEEFLLKEIEETVKRQMEKWNKKAIVHAFVHGDQLLKQMRKTPYDLVILDVEMPMINGLQVAKEIKNFSYRTYIILLTSHNKYAVKGYEINIYRYANKNDIPTLLKYLKDAVEEIERSSDQWLMVQSGPDLHKVNLRDIYSICKEGKYAIISTRHNGALKERKSLNEIYKNLDKSQFVFTDRSAIANLNHIIQLSEYSVTLDNQSTLPVSRLKRKVIKEQWHLFLTHKL